MSKTKRSNISARSSSEDNEKLAPGMQATHVIRKPRAEAPSKTYTPGEIGRPDDQDEAGQGDRQSDHLAELEVVEPDIDLDKPAA